MNSAELAELIGLIRADPAAPRVKDGFTYKLVAGRKTFLINMDKIPAKYRGLFDKLKSGLKIVK